MRTHKGRRIHLAGLADGGGVVHHERFEACEIAGPAIFIPFDPFELVNSTLSFDLADLDASFWTIPDGRPQIYGAIGLDNVAFDNCIFDSTVAWAGTAERVQWLKSSLIPPSGER